MPERNESSPSTVKALQLRAAVLCSNPDCRCLTIAPSESSETDWVYIGFAAHITAAAGRLDKLHFEKGNQFVAFLQK